MIPPDKHKAGMSAAYHELRGGPRPLLDDAIDAYLRASGIEEAMEEAGKLRAALLWIDTFYPETTAAAEKLLGFELVRQSKGPPQ